MKQRRRPGDAPPADDGRGSVAAMMGEVLLRLHEEYPAARCSLHHKDAFELLVATILSAQCTDERVNLVLPSVFSRFPDADAMAGAAQEELEELIRSTGFFRNKARSLIGAALALSTEHAGEVPASMDALVELPGVGRKTANVVLGNAFRLNEGIVVDTHVKRIACRLGLTGHTAPERIEEDLVQLAPREEWTELSHLFIFHGRAVCKALRPQCGECVLADICPSADITAAG